MAAAEQALKIAPANREANRVLGTVYAALSESSQDRRRAAAARRQRRREPREGDSATSRRAIDGAVAESDPNVRATLARLYVRSNAYDKAIPLLTDLVNQEPGWQDGPLMLVEAYAGAGRSRDAHRVARRADRRAIRGCCRRSPTSTSASSAGRTRPAPTRARCSARRATADLKTRYASALLNAGGRDNLGRRATRSPRSSAARTTDARALYLLSQAQRRLGEFTEAEARARRVIAQNTKSPWGYYALAEALEERRQYQAVVDELAPVVAAEPRQVGDASFDVSLLLPHLGFAYQELGQHDKAIASFEEARKLAPDDPAIAGYLIEANIAAKKYGAAVDAAKSALAQHPERSAADAARGAGAAPERQGRSGHRAARGRGQAARGRSDRLHRRSRRPTPTRSAARRR